MTSGKADEGQNFEVYFVILINFYFSYVRTASKTFIWSLLTAYFESLLFDHCAEELRLRSFVGSFYNSGAKERS